MKLRRHNAWAPAGPTGVAARLPILLGVLLGVCGPGVAQVLPDARNFSNAWQNAGYDGDIPTPDTIVNVRDFGAVGDGVTDDAAAIIAAIASLGGNPGVVYFPPGTYYLASNISIGSGVVLRGHRPSTTTLRFETLGHCINMTGNRGGAYQAIVSGYTMHSSTIEVTDGSVFQPGDYAETYQNLDPAWTGVTWDNCGQMVRIASVAGNTLTLEHPLRLTYSASLNPQIKRVTPIQNAGVENLKVERLIAGTADDRDNRYTIRTSCAANCWVRGVESYNGFGGHVALVYSTKCEVTGCVMHHAHDYDGGGSGYGTRLEYVTGECLIENNILYHLRHSMLQQAFVNGNVLGYNYSFENYWVNSIEPSDLAGDIACHGNYVYANLFEGNIVQHIWIDDSHGLNGPYNTFVRNRAELRGLNCSSSQTIGQNYIGNEAFKNTYLFGLRPGDGYSPRGSDNFEYGNNTESDGLQAPGTGDLTDYSYYLGPDPTQPPPTPDWWDIADAIPTIGPPHSLSPVKNIPAYARVQAGGVLTVGPPSLFQQPTNIVVDQGQPAAFTVGAVGTPAASYQWSLADAALSGETNATLTIASAQPADAGTYHVIVSDPHGSVRSADVTLTVNATDVKLVTAGNPARYGAPTPFGYGTSTLSYASLVTNEVATPIDTAPGTREACTGWTGTGSLPAAGSSNRFVAALTTDSALTWNWLRQYYLDVSHTGNGTVDVDSGWLAADTNITVRAIPKDRYQFLGWSGDVPLDQAASRSLSLAMTSPRTIVAGFGTNIYLYGTIFVFR